MSAKIEWVCDQCQKPLGSDPRVTLECVNGVTDWPTSPFSGKPSADFCIPCIESVFAQPYPSDGQDDDPTTLEARKKRHDENILRIRNVVNGNRPA